MRVGEDRLEARTQSLRDEKQELHLRLPSTSFDFIASVKGPLPQGASDMYYQFGKTTSTNLCLYRVTTPDMGTNLEVLLLILARNSPSTYNYRPNAKNHVVKF